MTIQDYARKYFGAAKVAEPFQIDKITDVTEAGAGPSRVSDNIISPRNLPTDDAVRDFATLIRPFFPTLKILQGPVREPFDGDSQGRMALSGAKKAAWMQFMSFNLAGAVVTPLMMVGPLIEIFGLMPTPEESFARIIGDIKWAAVLEPSPTN